MLLNGSPKEYSNSPALSRVTFAAHPINRNAGINNKTACRTEETQRYVSAILVTAQPQVSCHVSSAAGLHLLRPEARSPFFLNGHFKCSWMGTWAHHSWAQFTSQFSHYCIADHLSTEVTPLRQAVVIAHDWFSATEKNLIGHFFHMIYFFNPPRSELNSPAISL